jgi:hypothetical protein
VEHRHADAVRARLRGQVRHRARVLRFNLAQFVLELVGDHAAAAVADLVARDDGIDLAQPLVGRGQVDRVVGARFGLVAEHPAGKAAAGQFGVHIRAGPHDHVHALFFRDAQQAVHVAHAAEVVDAGFWRMVGPVEVERDAVEAERLHFLDHVAPQRGIGQAERMDLARPYHDALAVDLQRVLVPADLVRFAAGGGRRSSCRCSARPDRRSLERRRIGRLRNAQLLRLRLRACCGNCKAKSEGRRQGSAACARTGRRGMGHRLVSCWCCDRIVTAMTDVLVKCHASDQQHDYYRSTR